MTRKGQFIRVLELHGTDIAYKTMKSSGEYSEVKNAKAFIQPLRYKNKMYIGNNYIPIGGIDGGHYLYIGSPDLRFDKEADTVIINTADDSYYIKRAEPYIVDNEVVYIWAILAKHSTYTEPSSDGTDNAENEGGTAIE